MLSGASVWARQAGTAPLHFDAISAFFTLWYLVLLTGRVSFAQFNPALTLVWIIRSQRGHFARLRYGLPYFFAQFAGAFAGALFVWWAKGEVAFPSVPSDSSLARACVYEALGSFFLIALILGVSESATDPTDSLVLKGASIGLGLIVVIFFTQGVSGAGINPAVACGVTLAEFLRTTKGSVLDELWVYLVFPLVGALLALLFHELSARPTLTFLARAEAASRPSSAPTAPGNPERSTAQLVGPGERDDLSCLKEQKLPQPILSLNPAAGDREDGRDDLRG